MNGKTLNELIKGREYAERTNGDLTKVGGITRPKETKYDIYITVNDYDEEILTNEEPVTLDEVSEAIRVMQKPSFFGKRLTEIRLVVR